MGILPYARFTFLLFITCFLIIGAPLSPKLSAKNVTKPTENSESYFSKIFDELENKLYINSSLFDRNRAENDLNENIGNDIFPSTFMCQIQTQLSQTSCVDNGGGSYTANFDLVVAWEGAPASEDINVTVGGSSIGLIDLSTAISPDTISLSLNADGIGQDSIIAFFETTTSCADTFILKSPVPCPPIIGGCTILDSIILGPSTGAFEADDGTTTLNTNPSFLDLLVNSAGDTLTAGLHFSNVNIPNGATIINAYIQFENSAIINTDPISIVIKGNDVDNASLFDTDAFEITTRSTTTDSVLWSPPNWTMLNEMGVDQQTPNLSDIIQEITDRSGWNANQDLAFIFSGSGRRRAFAQATLYIDFQYLGACPTSDACNMIASDEIAGTVWEDYNCDGQLNETVLSGIQGIQVDLHDCIGDFVATTYTNANGNYEFSGLSNQKYRVSFTLPENVACWAKPTHSGTDNGTMVQFVEPNNCASLGLSNPADYCEADPLIGLTCFSEGTYNGSASSDPAIISLPFDAEGHDFTGTTKTADYQGTVLDSIGGIGAAYGLAWQSTRQRMYLGAYQKRFSGFGSAGPDAIYQYDLLGNKTGTIELDVLLGGTNTAGVDPHDFVTTNNGEIMDLGTGMASFDGVGKISFGDLEMSSDMTTLYTVNLFDRKIYAINVADGVATNASLINTWDTPDPSGTGIHRPFALKFHQGKLWVGIVTEDAANAYVYALDVLNGTFNLELTFPLDYDRQSVIDNNADDTSIEGDWLAWASDADATTYLVDGDNPDDIAYPQPMLTDIEFDGQAMILGFRDRFGDQSASDSYFNNIDAAVPDFTWPSTAGDILRACYDGFNYSIESGNNGDCLSVSGLDNSGPGGEEYYHWDYYNFNRDWNPMNSAGGFHWETTQGALLQLPNNPYIITTAMDPYSDYSGGIIRLNNKTGRREGILPNDKVDTMDLIGGYTIYESGDFGAAPPPNTNGTFGKANGLGDLEAFCGAAPLEIGNYVWCDSLQNGLQDACEKGIDGLIVQLYDINGRLIGQDSTSNEGYYYFNQYNVDTAGITVDANGVATPVNVWSGMDYNATCYIVFGDGQFNSGNFKLGKLNYEIVDSVNVNNNTANLFDSDIHPDSLTSGTLGSRPDGLPFLAITTDNNGCGDHKYDLALSCCNLKMHYTQNSCTDNGNGTYTANYDLEVIWSGVPSGENLEVLVNNSVIQTITVSSSISPDTIAFSLPSDGIGKDTIIVRAITTTACADTLIFKSPIACPNDVPTCASNTGCLGGNAFEDFNCNGFDDTYEPGVQGIKVVIYNCQNNAVDTVWTDSEGDWQVCDLTDGDAYRVEFILPESIACWAQPTHSGSDNGTDVQFLTAPACTKFSISNPADYCQANPPLSVVCYLQPSDAMDAAWLNEAAIVQIPYESGTIDMTTAGLATLENEAFLNVMATNGEVGSVFGLATDNINDAMYATSFMKRHIPFGPSGPGAIYKMTNGTVTTFLDLNTLISGSPAGLDGHSPSGDNYQLDDIWDAVGKTSFGDLLITPDGQHLYTVTLTDKDRKLYRIAIPSDGSNPTASDIEAFELPSPTDCPSHPSTGASELNYNVRPGALKYEQGVLYVGLTCTAESTQDLSDLKGYVYSFEPTGNSFTGPLLTIPFNYNRAAITTIPSTLPGNFYPWNANQLTTTTSPAVNGDAVNASYPMPWLMNIDFSDEGCMVLGITDRFGHLASGAHNPPAQLNGNAGGDILKACNISGGWTLESNGNDGINPVTAGAGTSAGPGNGEFFFGESFETFHNEISNGGFAILPGLDELVLGVYDPPAVNGTLPGGSNGFDSGGLIYLNTSDGARTRSYMLFNRNDYPDFGLDKASATGGIVLNCEPAPLEIGNYVWCDSIPNGIQDACEKGVDSLVVQLYSATGTLVGQDTTLNGNYYFNQNNVDTTGLNPDGSPASGSWTGLNYNSKYYLVYGNDQYENNAFYVGSDIYNGLTTANVNSNGNDNVDSDIDSIDLSTTLGDMPAGYPVLCINTSETGCGDHRYDVGLLCSIEPLECPCPTTYSLCWDDSGFNEPPNDDLSNFPWVDTMENISSTGIDMVVTLFQPARDLNSDTAAQQSYVSPGDRCGCTFDEIFGSYLSCGEVFRNWSDAGDIPDTIIISFSEPIRIPNWGFGGFRVSGGAIGNQVAIASFTFYDGPNATGNKVVSSLTNPGGRGQIDTGDPLVAAINEFQDHGAQETELYNGTYYFEGQNNTRGWTMLDMGGAVVHSIMWTQFVAEANLSPKDYVSVTPSSLVNSGYITSLDFEKCNCIYDYGDLPDIADGTTGVTDYETYDSTGGPSHQIIPGLFLGDTVDFEIDGFPNALAVGDDSDNEDDEDGISILPSLNIVPGGTIKLPINLTNTTGDTAYLEAWIDWNGDGDFDEPNEMVVDLKDETDGVFPNYLTISVPTSVVNQTLIGFRIRLSNEDNMTPYGRVNSGEIEDYLIIVGCPQPICLPIEIQINKE